MESNPPDLHNAYVARYAPGLGTKYARSNYRLAAILGAVCIVALVLCVMAQAGWMLYAFILLVLGGGVAVALSFARGAMRRWAADDGLAVAVSDAGIALPRVGLLPWHEVTSVKVHDHSLTPRAFSLAVSVLAQLQGTDSTMYVDVNVVDSDAILSRMSTQGGVPRAIDTNYKLTGFKGVWGQGMYEPTFQAATQVLVNEAERRGIPVVIDVPKNYEKYLPKTNE
ncbi:hypothetical protein [Glaciibacter psychrotolerans]|uniref:Uncharacterized protein n=1 Tax=Glaciibacter psychrotolerans TaxID=670054 RepID=A0A7Z0EG06_9MICO|nr:hypothetical protein [Leifsonia psychrotolerans]NYJ20964.1 hypothetical protein [Leifsonia psychrotolerans]